MFLTIVNSIVYTTQLLTLAVNTASIVPIITQHINYNTILDTYHILIREYSILTK